MDSQLEASSPEMFAEERFRASYERYGTALP